MSEWERISAIEFPHNGEASTKVDAYMTIDAERRVSVVRLDVSGGDVFVGDYRVPDGSSFYQAQAHSKQGDSDQ